MLSTLGYIRSSLRKVRDEIRKQQKNLLNNLSDFNAANIGAGQYDSPVGWWSADQDTGFVIDKTMVRPLRDVSLDFAYCSMFLERIDDDVARNLFTEIARALKPGRVFRVVVPDFWLYLRKDREGDRAFLSPDASYTRTWQRLGVPVDMEHLLVAAISRIHNLPHVITHYPHRENLDANPPVVIYPFEERYAGYCCGPAPEMTTDAICGNLARGNDEEFLNWVFRETCDSQHQDGTFNSWHKSWWNLEKLKAFGHEAGFQKCEPSGFGESPFQCPPRIEPPAYRPLGL
ncbi:MAG TPA: hypothetical protein VJQ06_12535 [Rhizomicrobium sp.]|nr:hypothetical protein [Rhizomicrobium sp.]